MDIFFYIITLVLTFFSRKIFLDRLGAEFIGLTGTLQNILGLLNIAELGIGVAVSYALYRPLHQQNRLEIDQIVSVFGYMYRRVGLVIMAIAVFVSLFLPLIFKGTGFSFSIIYFAFYSFLVSTLISYFCNYRSILLSADQKNYLVNAYFKTGNIIKTLIQLYIARQCANYYIWITIELLYGGVCSCLLNWKIRRVYPWLDAHAQKGREQIRNYPEIMTRTKQVFVHKLKDFFLGQSDQILIYAFASLSMVAYYGNYTMIMSRSAAALGLFLTGLSAGVGNLVAENNHTKILSVFWELISIRYFITGVIIFGLYNFTQPLITLWLGEEYLLPRGVFLMLLTVNIITVLRHAVDMYIAAYGLYADTWSAWLEFGINVTVSLIGGYFFGLYGLLAGKILSLLVVVVIWKPFYLFRDGFHEKYSDYWCGILRYIGICVTAIILGGWLKEAFMSYDLLLSGYIPFFCISATVIIIYSILQSILMYTLSISFRAMVARFVHFKFISKA